MSIESLAHADSLELQAMFSAAADLSDLLTWDEFDEMEREMSRLADLAEASTPDPRPEDFYYEDGPRAYAH